MLDVKGDKPGEGRGPPAPIPYVSIGSFQGRSPVGVCNVFCWITNMDDTIDSKKVTVVGLVAQLGRKFGEKLSAGLCFGVLLGHNEKSGFCVCEFDS